MYLIQNDKYYLNYFFNFKNFHIVLRLNNRRLYIQILVSYNYESQTVLESSLDRWIQNCTNLENIFKKKLILIHMYVTQITYYKNTFAQLSLSPFIESKTLF